VFKLCYYGIVLAILSRVIFVTVLTNFQLILLFMKLILFLVNFYRTIMATNVYFIIYDLIFLFMISLGMSGHFDADPIRACVKVDDYYDPSSAGTLSHVKSQENVC
jgi:hypothetical protein